MILTFFLPSDYILIITQSDRKFAIPFSATFLLIQFQSTTSAPPSYFCHFFALVDNPRLESLKSWRANESPVSGLCPPDWHSYEYVIPQYVSEMKLQVQSEKYLFVKVTDRGRCLHLLAWHSPVRRLHLMGNFPGKLATFFIQWIRWKGKDLSLLAFIFIPAGISFCLPFVLAIWKEIGARAGTCLLVRTGKLFFRGIGASLAPKCNLSGSWLAHGNSERGKCCELLTPELGIRQWEGTSLHLGSLHLLA